MTLRRPVRVTEGFFEDLDALLPPERSSAGTPSTADLLLYEIPRILELVATDLGGSTAPIAGIHNIRVLITSGMLVQHIAAYAVLHDDESVEIIALEIEH